MGPGQTCNCVIWQGFQMVCTMACCEVNLSDTHISDVPSDKDIDRIEKP